MGITAIIVNGVTYAKGEYWLDEQQPLPQQIKLYPRIGLKGANMKWRTKNAQRH
jgi:hypothetical protein